MKNFVEELKWRGMLHDIMPGTEEQLMKESTSAYIGFDPTADSLHVGSLAQIMTLKHFQRCGHKPYALVGGATGMVGDPSGKSQERNLLDEATLRKNQEGIKSQLEKFLDFNCGATSAEIVNNYDWMKEYTFLHFIRDIGKHIPINYMMAKDSVQNRLENGMSFTEFCYQLIQGYDFYFLYKNHNCKLQMGGSDQWGNITTGNEMIRRIDGGSAFALTTQLIKKADGTKFGKTEEGNVWLDERYTSPYKFYQFWINASDDDAEKYIKIFTILDKETIESIIEEHKKAPHLRHLQTSLAKEVTLMVHGAKNLEIAEEASKVLFGKSTKETLEKLDEETVKSIFEGVPQFFVDADKLQAGINVIDLLCDATQVFPSKSECRRMMKDNGLGINYNKITNPEMLVGMADCINGKYLLVQKGKKNLFLIFVK